MQMHRAVSLVSGAGIGAGLTFFLDPDRPSRRRDQGHRSSTERAESVGAAAGDSLDGPIDSGSAATLWVQPAPPESSQIFHRLERHETADVPALQELQERKPGLRIPLMQSNWSPTARAAAALMGTAAMLYGASRRTPGAATVAASGFGLLLRSMTNQELGKMWNFRIGSFGHI